ncbi:MAG: ACT domain-containing protein [Chloroflexota bacterium]
MGRQFVVQLDNRPGELAHLARALGTRGINITQISCAGTGSIACAFMTTTEDEQTREVLRGLGHDFVEGATVVVDVLDQPGGLAEVAERLATAGVNIHGTLCIGRRAGVIEMAFAVDDEAKARAALAQAQLAGVH